MKRILFFTTALLLQTFIFAQVPTGSLVGYWPFNGNANDFSGNSNNGVVTGASLTTDRFGICNRAYNFNGTNNKIVVPNSASIDMSNSTNFAVCFWMNTTVGATLPLTMISKNTYGSISGYEFFSSSGYCNAVAGQMSWYTAGTQAACSNTNICLGPNQGTWMFVVGMYDGAANTGSTYVNGVLQNATSLRTANLSTAVDLYFGCQSNSSEFYKGTLDDIRIYRRLLNQSEITALYNETSTITPVTATNTTPAGNLTFCAGNSTTLTAIAGTNTIEWYSTPTGTVPLASGNSFITPALSAGMYTYYLVAEPDCGQTRIAISLTVNPDPVLNITGPAATVCSGILSVLSASTANTYSWSNGLTTQSIAISPTVTTTYSVTGTSAAGCTASAMTTVSVYPNYLQATGSATICRGQSTALSSNGALTYTWQPGNLTGFQISVSPVATTIYTVSGTDQNNCTYATTATVTVSLCNLVNSIQAENSMFNIYPNPSRDWVTIEASETATLVLYSVYGQLLISENLQSGENRINISGFAKGIYFAHIKCGDATRTYKIVRDE